MNIILNRVSSIILNQNSNRIVLNSPVTESDISIPGNVVYYEDNSIVYHEDHSYVEYE